MRKPDIEIPTISFEYRHGTRYAIMYRIYRTRPLTACVQASIENSPLTACVQASIENSCSAVMSELVVKSRTSIIWDYYRLERGKDGKPVDNGSAICCSCRKRVMARQGSASNLLAHFELCMKNFMQMWRQRWKGARQQSKRVWHQPVSQRW